MVHGESPNQHKKLKLPIKTSHVTVSESGFADHFTHCNIRRMTIVLLKQKRMKAKLKLTQVL